MDAPGANSGQTLQGNLKETYSNGKKKKFKKIKKALGLDGK